MSTNEETTGIVGYVSPENVDRFASAQQDSLNGLELNFEPGSTKIRMRIREGDIVGCRPGGKEAGQVRLHVLLKPGTVVETVIESLRNVKAIDDPTLTRLTAAANVSVSFV